MCNLTIVHKLRHADGFDAESILGSIGTPIFQLYAGLGYINGFYFHNIPIAHTVLHGLCKDICKIFFDIKTKYRGDFPSDVLTF